MAAASTPLHLAAITFSTALRVTAFVSAGTFVTALPTRTMETGEARVGKRGTVIVASTPATVAAAAAAAAAEVPSAAASAAPASLMAARASPLEIARAGEEPAAPGLRGWPTQRKLQGGRVLLSPEVGKRSTLSRSASWAVARGAVSGRNLCDRGRESSQKYGHRYFCFVSFFIARSASSAAVLVQPYG